MKVEKLVEESKRCLQCKNARCQSACPISTSIPEVMALFQEGEVQKAGEVLFENNPISLVCSLICPFERQCMGNCIRGIKGDSVNFPAIEHFIMHEYLEHTRFQRVEENGKKVAIVGAGPAGISAAFSLRKKGYDVTIYDEHEKMGGMLRYGIPSFRLSKEHVDLLEEKVLESGIHFEASTRFTEAGLHSLKEREGFDAVFISTGAWKAKKIPLEGSEAEHVFYGLDYLKDDVNLGKNKKVVVIGAGNVAMDVARTGKRQGNDVLVAYRRTLEEAPATKAEIEETKEDGVEFMTEVSPVRIQKDGILLERKHDKTQFLEACDHVILAISQESHFAMKEQEGYFYAGDILTGPETVVKASFTAMETAEALHHYLVGKERGNVSV